MKDQDQLLTLHDVSELTGLSEHSIRHKVRKGKIPVVCIDRRLRFRHKAVMEWISTHSVSAEEQRMTAEHLAQRFHELYESLAPKFGYELHMAVSRPWKDVPEKNKRLMIAVCDQLLTELRPGYLMPAVEDDDGE